MEARKDYILDRWVYFAPERAKRRKEFETHHKVKLPRKDSKCFFCQGNESLTPPEIGRLEENGKWKIRWFPNKFPAVENKIFPKVSKPFITKEPAYGFHEVIAECPEHDKQLWDLDEKHIKQLLEVYKERIAELSRQKGIKYVSVFKNYGPKAGTSLVHSHTQVAAISKIPTLVDEELNAIKKHKGCPYCKIIKLEKTSKRKCLENSTFIAICPYASRFNYEVWLFPKKHIKNITELDDKQLLDLAKILKKILIKLKQLDASYNYFLHYAPKSSNLHFHIEITPRIAVWAGFEFSTNFTINSVMPEEAAKFYRA